jgi:phosphopentomutase
MARVFLVIIDGLGCGAQEDAHLYKDEDANTLKPVLESQKPDLPTFQALGLGNIIPIGGFPAIEQPLASYGKMREKSAGKDSTTGHWELAGLPLQEPFPTYPQGFPIEVIDLFKKATGCEGILCNKPYSGTAVIEEYGQEHMETGFPIVYTSADSVFQIAAHTDVVPLQTLYEWCEISRNEVMIVEHAVGRVIARPFHTQNGSFERVSDQRKDYSLVPHGQTLPAFLQEQGIFTHSIGKVIDLFAGVGFDSYQKTKGNTEGLQLLRTSFEDLGPNSFCFVNLIDTDQLYGHRLDPVGYAACLEEIDEWLARNMKLLGENDVLYLTGDHGNDPCVNSTDHTREFVPVLEYQKNAKPKALGIRDGFYDLASTITKVFGFDQSFPGTSWR